MPDLRLADISEFQIGANLAEYKRSGFDVLILRAHNGHRTDKTFWSWQKQARTLGFTALGFYQYMVESRPATEQARDFCSTVGVLRKNEFAICDNEEGAGSQIERCEQWFQTVDSRYGRKASLYSGESWFREKLGGTDRWKRPRWIAAYRSTEPTVPHEWWQNTSTASFPGIGHPVDCSLFHGTSSEFAAITAGKTQQPAPVATAEEITMAVGETKDGHTELFVERANGEVQHKWQSKSGGPWSGWNSLGTPGK